MSNFKNIEACGLRIFSWLTAHQMRVQCGEEFVMARDLESLLSQGVRVSGAAHPRDLLRPAFWVGDSLPGHTHTALVINVRPIEKPDTADSLLRDMIKTFERPRPDPVENCVSWDALIERAKRMVLK